MAMPQDPGSTKDIHKYTAEAGTHRLEISLTLLIEQINPDTASLEA
jgi:hypothetical protein